MLNRTIYYDEKSWLRNQTKVLNSEEVALRKEFGLKHVYPSDLFYRTHKITQKDLLNKLRQGNAEATIEALFDDEALSGRRGVLSLAEFQKRREKQNKNKERLQSFVRKFENEGMSTQEIKQTGFMRHSMLY
jgi:hypothetical protein